jgi:predicted permease
MPLWRQIVRGVRALVKRGAADRDIADEVESYLAESAAALREQGHSPEEARRIARLNAGSALALRDEVRSAGWENAVADAFLDVRYAARRLRGNPGFTAVSVLTLALGIGATTAIFSVIESVLLKPLPYSESGRIVALKHTAPGIHIKELFLASSLYFTYREESRAFEDVGMWTTGTATVTGVAAPEEVPALSVTYGFLSVLRTQPALGRRFTALDDDPKSERTVLLSDAWWKMRFGGDRSVVGRRILIDGNAWEVIGVLPPSFQFMDRRFSVMMPMRLNRSAVRLISFCCQGIARLKPGVSLVQANADVARMLPLAPLKFALNAGAGAKGYTDARIAPDLRPLKDDLLGDTGDTLWVLMGTVGIVLLIACANVANLLLVRADGRRQELAVRAALGAGWRRIARDLLCESGLLGIGGGALGLALAYAALRVIVASGPAHLPRLQEISIDPLVLGFALAISLGAGLLFGWIPVWKHARPHASIELGAGGRSVGETRERYRARSVLIVIQVALAMVLLVASGLMLRTLQALRRVDPGFSVAGDVETFHVSLPATLVQDPERVVRTQEAILRKVEAISGVSSAGMVNVIPLDGGSNNPVYVEDQPTRDGGIPPIRRYKFLSPGYAGAIGTRLVAGRDITWAETYRQAPVALISENMARELWRDPRAAVGKRIRGSLNDDWREVIGVLADLYDDGVDRKAPAIVYWPLWQRNFNGNGYVMRNVVFVVRTRQAGSEPLRRELEKAIAGVNANVPLAGVKTLQSWYERSLARSSFALVLLAIAAGMALLLGVVGIYGVISYAVAQRSREIGIRLALGAPGRDVVRMFVRHALALAGIGAACGLAGALLLTRLMKSLLYHVSPADPLTYGAVSAGLVAAAILASYLPARRASRVDPMQALRAD